MKYTIVVPTYIGHLRQVELFLESFERFCLDKDSFEIKLIISKNESHFFDALTKKYERVCNLSVVNLSDILKQEEGVEVDEPKLLAQVGKFNFQSLKKIYAVKHFNTGTILVLDSEALMIRPVVLGEIFEQYRRDKFIVYTDLGTQKIQRDVAHTSFELIGKSFENLWFFEYDYWFFEKDLVDALFKHVLLTTGKTLYENLLVKNPIFEYNLYALYVYYFHKEKYRFLDSKKLLAHYLGDTLFEEYKI